MMKMMKNYQLPDDIFQVEPEPEPGLGLAGFQQEYIRPILIKSGVATLFMWQTVALKKFFYTMIVISFSKIILRQYILAKVLTQETFSSIKYVAHSDIVFG